MMQWNYHYRFLTCNNVILMRQQSIVAYIRNFLFFLKGENGSIEKWFDQVIVRALERKPKTEQIALSFSFFLWNKYE